MAAPFTFLAPGQRYTPRGEPAWRTDRQVMVARIDLGIDGRTSVTFHRPDGEQVTFDAAQVEAAVADGSLAPVVGMGWVARC